MIKLIREGSKQHPWILKAIMLVIAVTFVIGMGWFGYETAQQPTVVAVAAGYEVKARDFRRAYNAAYDAQQQREQPVEDDELKETVINALVGQKLWLAAADNLDVDAHPEALRRAIMARPEFERDGSFDPAFYHRLLAQNRLTPQQFEAQLATDLRIQTVRFLVQDAVTLNPSEQEEVEDIAARQLAETDDDTAIETITTRVRRQILDQKRQRALQAFHAALHKASDVEIRKDYL